MQTEVRCTRCGKLLAKADTAKMEIKCPRCGHINRVHMSGTIAKY